MSLVLAKCPQCGGNVEVDNTKEAAICTCCDSPFIVEKAINNYNTYTTNNYEGATINVLDSSQESADYLYNICIQCCKKGEYDAMGSTYKLYAEKYPTDYRVYYIALLRDSMSFTKEPENKDSWSDVYFLNKLEEHMLKLKKWGEVSQIVEICEKYYDYIEMYKHSSFTSEEYVSQLNVKISLNDLKQFMGESSSFHSKAEIDYISKDGSLHNLSLCKLVKERDKLYFQSWNRYTEHYNWFLIRDLDSDGKFSFLPLRIDSHDVILKKMYLHSINEDGTIEIKYWVVDPIMGIRCDKLEGYVPTATEGCYVATAVYGSYDCPEVWVLRRYRDNYLKKTYRGRLFVALYYAISPTAVKIFGKCNIFNKFWKPILDKKVAQLKQEGVKDTPYVDIH